MTYLDAEHLDRIDADAFRSQRPYPWINPEGLLTEDGYRRLRDSLPDLSLFESRFGSARKYGQRSHDRFSLEWQDDLPVAPSWKEFVEELRGDRYQQFLRRLLGTTSFHLSFHWHYTPNGCSVSPHCDAKRKLGSHIFYFNTKDDWDPSWGGETLILDDHGRFSPDSAPGFQDFDQALGAQALGNYSLLFTRKGNSWHGVREIQCPDGALRKVFIVVINRWSLGNQIRNYLFGRHAAGY